MQSQNGDVQLSVRLDTKGIKSDAQKIRDEIQKTVEKTTTTTTRKSNSGVNNKSSDKSTERTTVKINTMGDAMEKAQQKAQMLNEALEQAKNVKLPTDEYNKLAEDAAWLESELEKANTQLNHMELLGEQETSRYSGLVNKIKEIESSLQNVQGEMQGMVDLGEAFTIGDEEEVARLQKELTLVTEEIRQLSEQPSIAESVNEARVAIEGMKFELNDSQMIAESMAFDLAEFADGFKYSDEFNRLNDVAQQLTKEFNKGAQELLKMEMEGQENTDEFNQLALKTGEVAAALHETLGTLNDMRVAGTAFTEGINVEEVKNVERAYDALTNKITMEREAAKRAAEAEKVAQKQALLEAKEAEKAEIAATKAAEQARIEAEKAAAARKRGILNILGSFKKLIPSVNSVKKGLTGIGMSFKQFLGAALGIRGLFVLFSKLKSAITDSMQSLAKMNGGNNEVNRSLSTLMSALTQLKNAWGAAFAPILTAVTPILTNLINMLTRAANAVAQFIAVVTGKSTWMKAKQVQQDYAKSLNKTGKAAKDAAGKLAAFDDLNVLGKDKNDEDSGGGDGGLDPNAMFEEVDVDPWFKDLWEKLKEMWANADFTELGAALGQKLKEALDSIDWDAVKEFARKLGKSIATFLNGFFETEGLGESIGKTLAESLNTAFEFLYAFVENFHWDSFGKFIGETLNGIFHNIDWDLIAKTLAHGLNGLLTTLATAVRTTDWHSLTKGFAQGLQTMFREIDFSTWTDTISALIIGFGDLICGALDGIDWVALPTDLWNGIVELWEGIDWDGLGDVISRLLYSAVKAACDLLVGLAEFGVILGDALRASWEKTKNYFEEWTEIAGGDVIKGIFLGIVNALANIGMWVYEHIFEPIINAFKDAFGISSPSTVMAEQGVFIMKGLFEGIKSLMGAIIEIWNNLKTKVLEVVENLKNKVHEKWENLKTKTKTAWESIKNTVQEKATAMKEKAVTIATTMKTNVSEKWSELKKKGVDTFTSLKETVIKIWEAIKEGIKTPINGIISFIESFINGVIWGINKLFEFLNSLQIDIPEWVPEIGGQTMGFDFAYLEPITIPRLAQGAVIPPNKEFLAMLGDQKQGTNIEAPLDTIKEAFADVVGNLQVQNTGYAEMKLDGETVARLLVPYVISELNRRGYDLKLIGA